MANFVAQTTHKSKSATSIAAREKAYRAYKLASFAGIDRCEGLKWYNLWVWKDSPACPAYSVQHAFNYQHDCNAHMMVRHWRANDNPSKNELEYAFIQLRFVDGH